MAKDILVDLARPAARAFLEYALKYKDELSPGQLGSLFSDALKEELAKAPRHVSQTAEAYVEGMTPDALK